MSDPPKFMDDKRGTQLIIMCPKAPAFLALIREDADQHEIMRLVISLTESGKVGAPLIFAKDEVEVFKVKDDEWVPLSSGDTLK
jgi:hypothetical protein